MNTNDRLPGLTYRSWDALTRAQDPICNGCGAPITGGRNVLHGRVLCMPCLDQEQQDREGILVQGVGR